MSEQQAAGPSGNVAGRPIAVIVEADGGSRGNPGPAGFGALLRDAGSGEVIAQAYESIGIASNNVAEYRGLIAGLELYAEYAPTAQLEVRMDSKLVIEQMAGRWKIRHPDMRPLAVRAQRLVPAGTVWSWVPREQNQDADRLANQAMDRAVGGPVPASPGGSGQASAARQDPVSDPAGMPSSNPVFGWPATLGTPTTVILIRHGVTAHTLDRKFSGPGGENPGLTSEGVEQAQRAAKALPRGDIDAIITSPLRRARETAEPIAAELEVPVEVVSGFAECAFGAWDGKTLEEVRQAWPMEFDAWLQSTDYPPPGGESLAEVRRRVEAALEALLTAYPDKTVVVVSHVNPIKLCVRYCLQAPVDVMYRMHLAPGSLSRLAFYESGGSLLQQFSALP